MRFSLIFYFCIGSIIAQESNNFQTRIIQNHLDSVKLDSNAIRLISIEREDGSKYLVNKTNYHLNPSNAWFYWKSKDRYPIKINFRHLGYNFNKTDYKTDYKLEKDKAILFIPSGASPYQYELWQSESKIRFDGSIARELAMGNNQSAVLNSRMNMQLSGNLTEDIELSASITDENIPFQPEGSTADIQDFDKVFINLRSPRMFLNAGDIEIIQDTTYFLRYRKNQKGIYYQWNRPKYEGINGYASFSVAKGKYCLQAMNGEEANQGPYRLYGKNGESFIIIIAGSERVFIDGKRLERGDQNDYTIDYNTAEITFTSKRMITKDHRIRVEFEYADQNYMRSTKTMGFNWSQERMTVKLDVYSQRDHKNQSIQQSLSNNEKALLIGVGDSIQDAFTFQFDSLPYDDKKVRYALKDSLSQGVYYDSIFIYSNNENEAHYKLNFVFVGEGQGYYALSDTNINGRIYEWKAPKDGSLQGAYAPIKVLVSPQSYDMLHLSSSYSLNQSTQVGFDVGLSQKDVNTFSDQNDEDDIGLGVKIYLNNQFDFGKDTIKSKRWKVKQQIQTEFISSSFEPIERFRSIEFDRDWGLIDLDETEDLIHYYKVHLKKTRLHDYTYSLNYYTKSNEFKGLRQYVRGKSEWDRFTFNINSSYLSAQHKSLKNTFLRPNFGITKQFKKLNAIELAFNYDGEENTWHHTTHDSLDSRSYKYDAFSTTIKNADSSNYPWRITYFTRYDYRTLDNLLQKSSSSDNIDFQQRLWAQGQNTLSLGMQYRSLDITSANIEQLEPDDNLSANLDYRLKILNGAVIGQSFYQVGRGLEQKREYMFVEVMMGEGVYTWIDNGDGIQALDEFEISAFQDQANYIKVFTVGNDYQKVYALSCNQSLNIKLKPLITDRSRLSRMIQKLSAQLNAQIQRKTLASQDYNYMNPFYIDFVENDLVSVVQNMRNIFFYNRGSSKFSIEWHQNYLDNKLLLVNGFEKRGKKEEDFRLRYYWNRHLKSQIQYILSSQSNASDWSENKNFNIYSEDVRKRLEWTAARRSRLGIESRYALKYNRLDSEGDNATIKSIKLDWNFNFINKSVLRTSFSLVKVDYIITNNINLNYIMLEAFQPGQNSLWNVTWQKKLNNNVQMRISYDFRSSENNKNVHVGRANVRYLF